MDDPGVLNWALIIDPSTLFLYGGEPRFLGMDMFSSEMGENFRIIYVYAPYHSRVEFWNHLLQLLLMNSNNLILGGDLKLTILHEGYLGRHTPLDPLS